MEKKESFTAEQALAALSFLSNGLSLQHTMQQESSTVEKNEKAASPPHDHDPKEWSHIQALIPDWIEEDDEACDENDNDQQQKCYASNKPRDKPLSWLEGLGPDVSALILSHLSLSEISTVSLVSSSMHRACRTNELWRNKFVARWNHDGRELKSWFSAFRAAYANPHDLWVTHWNCVLPKDGDSPGRCCVPSRRPVAETPNDAQTRKSPWMKYCPTCRYSSPDTCLPALIQEALDQEQDSNQDLVHQAEVTAAAHALLLEQDGNNHRASAIFATTQYAIAKWCRRVAEYPPGKSHDRIRRARQAFEEAATFHRTIQTEQYQSDGLNFLTDVLFFSVVDSHLQLTQEAVEEKEHLKRDVFGDNANVTLPGAANTVSSLGPHMETCHHTWHIVRFTNPDYVRPITFRIFVQRPDCFTVFPSEGFLKPGQTCHIVLGVRLLGSLLAEAFEALNVQREEVDPFLADVYAHEAHLPYAPFAIRYMFAPVMPCIPPSFTSRGGIKPAQSLARPALTQAATSKYKHVGEYLWENVATEATVRTLYLSAHVHANYRFEEFQRATLSPFEIRVRSQEEWGSRLSSPLDPMVYVAPNLLQKDRAVYELMENMRLETEFSDAGQAYRTEKKCLACLRDWGARSEELGRSYILQSLVCDGRDRQKELQMRNLVAIIRHVYAIVHFDNDPSIDMQRVYGLLYVLHSFLVQKRATPLISRAQRQLLLQLECVVDELCRTVQEDLLDKDSSGSDDEQTKESSPERLEESMDSMETNENLWKNVGVYRFTRCTDSVYGREVDLPSVESDLASSLKDELGYLDGFRYLCHSPGLYCLGQQQDPNHDDPKIMRLFDIKSSPISRVIHRGNRSRHSDIFMDNHTLAFACALSMIHDPRSLLVHGVYDRVAYPGTIARRPHLPPSIFARVAPFPRDTNALREEASMLVKKWKSQNLKRSALAYLDSRTKFPDLARNDSMQFCLQSDELDIESHDLVHVDCGESEEHCVHHLSSLQNYVQNVPPPGVGRFPLSAKESPEGGHRSELVSLHVRPSNDRLVPARGTTENGNDDELSRGPGEAPNRAVNVARQQQPPQNGHQNGRPQPFVDANVRGPQVVNLLWLISAHFGWTVDNTQGAGSVLVDRRILIASQWISNSLMAMPLLWTLLARYVKWITPKPIDYHLEGLPYEVGNEMRFLTATECGSAACFVLALWLMMGRYAERRIGRSFERSMMEHLSNQRGLRSNSRLLTRAASSVVLWFQRQWDRMCPLFLQRLVFTPRWNRRSDSDVRNHITAWRSKDLREHR